MRGGRCWGRLSIVKRLKLQVFCCRCGKCTSTGGDRPASRLPLCLLPCPPREEHTTRTPHWTHCHVGSAGQPRHRLHPPHLRLQPVLPGNVPGGAPSRVPAGGDAGLRLPGVCPVCHRAQARLSSRAQVRNVHTPVKVPLFYLQTISKVSRQRLSLDAGQIKPI